jgi:hypothetical protein
LHSRTACNIDPKHLSNIQRIEKKGNNHANNGRINNHATEYEHKPVNNHTTIVDYTPGLKAEKHMLIVPVAWSAKAPNDEHTI